jgi:hypothetical protein
MDGGRERIEIDSPEPRVVREMRQERPGALELKHIGGEDEAPGPGVAIKEIVLQAECEVDAELSPEDIIQKASVAS